MNHLLNVQIYVSGKFNEEITVYKNELDERIKRACLEHGEITLTSPDEIGEIKGFWKDREVWRMTPKWIKALQKQKVKRVSSSQLNTSFKKKEGQELKNKRVATFKIQSEENKIPFISRLLTKKKNVSVANENYTYNLNSLFLKMPSEIAAMFCLTLKTQEIYHLALSSRLLSRLYLPILEDLLLTHNPISLLDVPSKIMRENSNVSKSIKKKVDILELPQKPLAWKRSRTLSQFTRVKSLKVSKMNQREVIKYFYSQSLEKLEFSVDQIDSIQLCKFLERHPHLREITLDCYHLKRETFTFIAKYCPLITSIHLTTVLLKDDLLDDELIIFIAKSFPHLEILRLDDCVNTITDKGLIVLSERCIHLKELSLEGINVSDQGLTACAENCSKLTSILIESERVTDEGMIAISKNCKNLRDVSLYGTELTQEGFISFARNCPKLKKFIGDFLITDEMLAVLAEHCPLLVFLDLEEATIQDATFIDFINKHPKIEYVNLNECENLTDKSFKALAKCTHLKKVDFSGSLPISKKTLLELISNNLGLSSVNLSGLKTIDDEILSALSKCLNLKNLQIKGSQKITDRGVEALGKCIHLTHLSLIKCKGFTDEGFENGVKFWKKLLYLNLRETEITEQSLESVVKFCRRLVYLDLCETKITDKCLVLIQALPLENLLLSRCFISERGVLKFTKRSKTLKGLLLSDCPHIPSQKRFMLHNKYPTFISLD